MLIHFSLQISTIEDNIDNCNDIMIVRLMENRQLENNLTNHIFC